MKRLLTPQEHALWRRSLRDVRPLKPGSAPLPPETGPKSGDQPASSKPAGGGLSPRRTHPSPRSASASLHAAADPFASGDPKLEQRVRRGRTPIEARLDLHGFHQGPARAALLRFLTNARANGHRCVLVVTGKGGRYASPGGKGPSGVLRASMRGWLREDAFRQHVARAATAHQRHGGEGAFYVFLKAPLSGRR